jgi:hypothetical protein
VQAAGGKQRVGALGNQRVDRALHVVCLPDRRRRLQHDHQIRLVVIAHRQFVERVEQGQLG